MTKPGLYGLLMVALVLAGCTSRKLAREQARTAYFAGQARAMHEQLAAEQAPAAAPVGDTVAIYGPVKVNTLRWTPDLTLIKTIVAAEYIPATPPRQITLIRNGSEIPVDTTSILGGDDVPVQPGDVVELKP